MIAVIKQQEFVKMPWRNGKGSTQQIYIDPPGATLAESDFALRLSSAPINEDGEFSVFQNKMRYLVPIQGKGFALNGVPYEKFEVAHFKGDEKTNCRLVNGPVLDFGLIYDPSLIDLQVRILQLKSNFNFALDQNAEYFFTVLNGNLLFGEDRLTSLETLHLSREPQVQLCPLKEVVVFFAKVINKK